MIEFKWCIDLFEYKKLCKNVSYYAKEYPEIIEVVGDFEINVNGETFFSQPYFPIIEFIRALDKWKETENIVYNCLETDDNPLISFISTNKAWTIKSSWQLFECKVIFSKGELLESFNKLKNSVKKQFEEL